jgi:hypothetical protein
MVGEEQMPRERAVMNPTVSLPFEPIVPDLHPNHRVACDGTPRGESGMGGESCPLYVKAPSLAMVYAPRQCWQNLLEPKAALAHGTLFADLALPFEAGKKFGEGEGRLSGK